MGWEDDVAYMKILIFSFISAYLIKRIPSRYRDVICALLGLATICLVGGNQIFYSLLMVLVNIVIIKLMPSFPLVNFIFCFGYLTFFRCAHLIHDGNKFPKYLPHANAVQLIITLRCVGLALEMSDQKNERMRKSAKTKSTTIGDHRSKLNGEWKKIFYYCYNLFGLFTGPYYTYRVHQDMIECQFLLNIPFASRVINRLITVPFFMLVLVVLQNICPYQIIHTDAFYEQNSFLGRLLYSAPVIASTRARFYIAWMLSESACMAAGIGAYPKLSKPKVGSGPSDLSTYQKLMAEYVKWNDNGNGRSEIEFDYETISNVDAYNCEFCCTFRESIRAWNRTVQYWLAVYVYQRVPCKWIRATVTMLVSAYWHGIHPGYYLAFVTIPICQYAEDLAFSIMEKHGKDGVPRQNHHFRLIWWFFRMRTYDYLIMAFLLLSWTSTVRYWYSICYLFHFSFLSVIIVCWILMGYARFTKDKKE